MKVKNYKDVELKTEGRWECGNAEITSTGTVEVSSHPRSRPSINTAAPTAAATNHTAASAMPNRASRMRLATGSSCFAN